MESLRLPTTAAQLAGFLDASIVGDETRKIDTLHPLEGAGQGSLTFLSSQKYVRKLRGLEGAVVMTSARFVPESSPLTYLVVENPEQAFAKVARELLPHPGWSGVSQSAQIDPSVVLGEGVSVGPFAVIGPKAVLGRGTRIYAHAVIGAGVKLGEDCEVHSHAVLEFNVQCGDRVQVLSGAVLGSPGFGLYTDESGKLAQMPQLGTVLVGDDVRIGAHCTIDRGSLGPTRIGNRTKLDDQVHIAHNVSVDEDCVICAQAGIAGSVTIERNVMLGGQVGLRDGIRVGEGARLGGQAGAVTHVPGNETYTLTPLVPASQVARIIRVFRRLPEVWTRLRALEKKVGIDESK